MKRKKKMEINEIVKVIAAKYVQSILGFMSEEKEK